MALIEASESNGANTRRNELKRTRSNERQQKASKGVQKSSVKIKTMGNPV